MDHSFAFSCCIHIILYADTGYKIESKIATNGVSPQTEWFLTISCTILSDQFLVLHLSVIEISSPQNLSYYWVLNWISLQIGKNANKNKHHWTLSEWSIKFKTEDIFINSSRVIAQDCLAQYDFNLAIPLMLKYFKILLM